MMYFKNYVAWVALLVVAPALCLAKNAKKQRGERALQTRALYPYLKLRATLPFADGSGDRFRAVAWHPTDEVFAIAGGPRNTLSQLMVYGVAGNATGARLQQLTDINVESSGHDTSYQINALSWNPAGDCLGVGSNGTATKQFRVYSYGNKTLSELTSVNWDTTTGGKVKAVAWHPSGKYVAIGGSGQTNSYGFIIYAFDALTPQLVGVVGVKLGSAATVNTLAWDATGTYLAVGCSNESTTKSALQLYSFNVGVTYSLTQASTVDFGGATASVKAVAWSPDNKYLVAGGYAGAKGPYEISLYTAPAGKLTAVSDATIDFGAQNETDFEGVYIDSLAWDPAGQYLLAGGYDKTAGPQVELYSFQNETFTPKKGTQITFGDSGASYVAALGWSASRKYAVIGGYSPGVTYNSVTRRAKEIWLMEFLTEKPVSGL